MTGRAKTKKHREKPRLASPESGIPHSSLRTPHSPSVFPVSDGNPFGLTPFEEGLWSATTPSLHKNKAECLSTVVRDAVATQKPLPVTRHLPVWYDSKAGVWLYQGNCLAIMDQIIEKYPDGIFDMIFADPPYFLSNGGITCHAGKMVSVNKGDWDKSKGPEENYNFNREWLSRCQKVLKPNGTIWVSGTAHVIHSVGFAMQQLGFKSLNDITWSRRNAPRNLPCRSFTPLVVTIIWAAKNEKSKHYFDYKLMKEMNGGKQMKSYWPIPAPMILDASGRPCPSEKPVELVRRMILASTKPGDLILDLTSDADINAPVTAELGRRLVGLGETIP